MRPTIRGCIYGNAAIDTSRIYPAAWERLRVLLPQLSMNWFLFSLRSHVYTYKDRIIS